MACIGSQTQTTGCSPWRAARSSGGSVSSTRPAPMRVISVSRPGMRPGFSASHSAVTSAAVAVGPSLTPSGLWTPAKKATWAPSAARVRSPIQSMCAEQSYQSPVSESRRVRPCS